MLKERRPLQQQRLQQQYLHKQVQQCKSDSELSACGSSRSRCSSEGAFLTDSGKGDLEGGTTVRSQPTERASSGTSCRIYSSRTAWQDTTDKSKTADTAAEGSNSSRSTDCRHKSRRRHWTARTSSVASRKARQLHRRSRGALALSQDPNDFFYSEDYSLVDRAAAASSSSVSPCRVTACVAPDDMKQHTVQLPGFQEQKQQLPLLRQNRDSAFAAGDTTARLSSSANTTVPSLAETLDAASATAAAAELRSWKTFSPPRSHPIVKSPHEAGGVPGPSTFRLDSGESGSDQQERPRKAPTASCAMLPTGRVAALRQRLERRIERKRRWKPAKLLSSWVRDGGTHQQQPCIRLALLLLKFPVKLSSARAMPVAEGATPAAASAGGAYFKKDFASRLYGRRTVRSCVSRWMAGAASTDAAVAAAVEGGKGTYRRTGGTLLREYSVAAPPVALSASSKNPSHKSSRRISSEGLLLSPSWI
ncbi:hypothetical protein cyc_07301 [Cyclospora cayetanensis]|uniref:Uncharacterized protein n=1 Tax=Cyclospora cayetanensis TaxID=88456 RepID=A0A1D3D196_9EIME|nr:hypothetical protein cyc_07301 [Cyclospora cayetanensis]